MGLNKSSINIPLDDQDGAVFAKSEMLFRREDRLVERMVVLNAVMKEMREHADKPRKRAAKKTGMGSK